MSNESDWELLSWSFYMLTALDRALETRVSFSLITFWSFLSNVVSSCSWLSTSASLAFVAFCYSVKTGPRFNSSICLNYLISPSLLVSRLVSVDCRWAPGSTHPVRDYVTRGSAAYVVISNFAPISVAAQGPEMGTRSKKGLPSIYVAISAP